MKIRVFLLIMIFAFAVAMVACDDDDDSGDDDVVDDDAGDDDSGDDDVSDDDSVDDDIVDDDVSDDDTVDDDSVDDDTMEMADGWLAPCDVSGDGTPDYILEDLYHDGVNSRLTVHLKDVDGVTVHTIGPLSLGTGGFAYHLMNDLDGDGLCEVVSVRQFLDYTDKDLVIKGKVLVLSGSGLTAEFDTGWVDDIYITATASTDISGDGLADLLINYRPMDAASSGWLVAVNAADDYQELWTINGGPGEGLNVLARAVDGFTGQACGDPDGPDAFLLERYDLYEEGEPQWRADWINRQGDAVGGFGPVNLKGAAQKSAGVMHLSRNHWQCAGLVVYPTANLFGSRFVLFDRQGEVLAQKDLGEVASLAGSAAMSLDGNETPDVVLWGSYNSGIPALWVAADGDDYGITRVVSSLPSGSYSPITWRRYPWLNVATDLRGDGESVFAVLPNGGSTTVFLPIPLYGVDLNSTGFSYSLPLPAGELLSDGGFMLPLAEKTQLALAVYAVTSEGSAPWTIRSTWALFAGDDVDPVYQADIIEGSFAYLGSLWDFDGDDLPEINEIRYPETGISGGRVRLLDPNDDFNVLLQETVATDHRLNLVGTWQ